MNIQLRCLECGKNYTCFYDNTRIYISIIETTCAHCGHTETRNLSKLLDIQTDNYTERLPKIAKMISMARELGRQLNDDGVIKKSKRNKK